MFKSQLKNNRIPPSKEKKKDSISKSKQKLQTKTDPQSLQALDLSDTCHEPAVQTKFKWMRNKSDNIAREKKGLDNWIIGCYNKEIH